MNSSNDQGNRRILVIDDNRGIHNSFREILRSAASGKSPLDEAEARLFGEAPSGRRTLGFTMESAYQGEEGIELVRAALDKGHPYAMAFVDMRMPPGMDGLETIVKLWELDSDLQVVICTAHSDYGWHDLQAKLGSSDRLLILKKPFDVIEEPFPGQPGTTRSDCRAETGGGRTTRKRIALPSTGGKQQRGFLGLLTYRGRIVLR